MTKPKLYPFQKQGAHALYTNERFLLADGMGMFKTSQSIFANSAFRKKSPQLRTLIVSPSSVREHWERELHQWAFPKPGIGEITYLGQSDARDARWVLAHYAQFSSKNPELQKQLSETAFDHVILDEVQNAKNPRALRTQSIKNHVDNAPYVSLLSGTPIPNTIIDLYTLLSFLEPEEFPLDLSSNDRKEIFTEARDQFMNNYFENPLFVKQTLQKRMLRRRAEDFLINNSRLPELELETLLLPLEGSQREHYEEIREQELPVGEKIHLLEKVMFDPTLIGGTSHSAKLDALDDIVAEGTSNGKVAIFSHLKTGFVDALVNRYSKHGALAITGDVTVGKGKREHIRKKFQQDPESKLLICTGVMNEGVDLTAATTVVNLMLPWTPADYEQRMKRSVRVGEVQKERVKQYDLIVTLPHKQSLDEARKDMLEAKTRAVSYLIDGPRVDPKGVLEILSRKDFADLQTPVRVPRVKKALRSENGEILRYYIPWRALGAEAALRKRKSNAEKISEMYPEFIMAKNAASIYVPLLKDLELEGSLDPLVDICCATSMLGYSLDRAVIGIDIRYENVHKGKEINPQSLLLQGPAHKLPIASGTAGFALNSLAYQMLEPKAERNEALNEMSRILRPGGYAAILMLANYLTESDEERFLDAIDDAGFDLTEYQKDLTSSKLELYLLQKTHEPKYNTHDLTFKGDPRWKQ